MCILQHLVVHLIDLIFARLNFTKVSYNLSVQYSTEPRNLNWLFWVLSVFFVYNVNSDKYNSISTAKIEH